MHNKQSEESYPKKSFFQKLKLFVNSEEVDHNYRRPKAEQVNQAFLQYQNYEEKIKQILLKAISEQSEISIDCIRPHTTIEEFIQCKRQNPRTQRFEEFKFQTMPLAIEYIKDDLQACLKTRLPREQCLLNNINTFNNTSQYLWNELGQI